jgi:uncharacterized membrane protein
LRATVPTLRGQVRLICIPSSDVAFGSLARDVFNSLGEPTAAALPEFERTLRRWYPASLVRPQESLASLDTARTVWYATNRGYGSRIEATFEVAAPLELVYEIYVDRLPEWQASLRLKLRSDSHRRIGREYATSYDLFGRTFEGVFRIVDVEAPRFVLVEALGAAGIRVWFATTFASPGTGTVVRVTGDYDLPSGLLPGVQAALLDRFVARDIERSHAILIALCQAETNAE